MAALLTMRIGRSSSLRSAHFARVSKDEATSAYSLPFALSNVFS